MSLRRTSLALALLTAFTAVSRAQEKPYDLLDQGFGRYVDRTDPLPWAMKVKSLSRGPYEFWRGSRDIFYAWAKSHCSDWTSDASAVVPSQGDVHFGNIGAYPTAPFGSLAFGLVDFDDSANLPFQLDLMSIYVSSRLVAEDKSIAFPEPIAKACIKTIVEEYSKALSSGKTASQLLAEDELVKAASEDAGKKYKKELDKFTVNRRFRTKIVKNDKLMEVLRPAQQVDRAALGRALVEAMARDPNLGKILNYDSANAFTAAIQDVAFRIRVGSSGSQGLEKILILMTEPLRGQSGDVILYLKQEIPSAAERQGLTQTVTSTPAERCVESMATLNDPPPLLIAAVELGGKSYWLTLKEPWSNELDYSLIQNSDDLLHYAAVSATALGAAHGRQARYEKIVPHLTPQLSLTLRMRGDTYATYCGEQYEQFVQDVRARELRKRADEEIQRSLQFP